MIPWQELDRARAPDGGAALRLMRRGGEFSIMLGANELMNSRLSGSEETLAKAVCARLPRPDARLLIGGLGMGFTLRAALATVGAAATVAVAELVPEVITWARGPMAEIFAGCLDDPRVVLRAVDVRQAIGEEAEAYDAIMLDVDNGPEGLTHPDNDRLYDLSGLAAARRALRPGGILAIWSCAPDARFARRLAQSGLAVEELKVRAGRTGRGARHVIWLATKRT